MPLVNCALPVWVVEWLVGGAVEVELRDRRDDYSSRGGEILSSRVGDRVAMLDHVDAAVEREPDSRLADAVGADLEVVPVRFVNRRANLLEGKGRRLPVGVVAPCMIAIAAHAFR